MRTTEWRPKLTKRYTKLWISKKGPGQCLNLLKINLSEWSSLTKAIIHKANRTKEITLKKNLTVISGVLSNRAVSICFLLVCKINRQANHHINRWVSCISVIISRRSILLWESRINGLLLLVDLQEPPTLFKTWNSLQARLEAPDSIMPPPIKWSRNARMVNKLLLGK